MPKSDEQVLNSWDESGRGKVNLIAGQVGITGNAGAVAANTPRITSASDDPTVVAIDKLNSLTNATVIVPTQITKTVAAIATPEALAADGTFFRKATLIAKKAARTANAGIVYLGIGATNDTQPFELNPGDIWTIEAPPGQKYDLNDWYLDVATAADGVMIVYS